MCPRLSQLHCLAPRGGLRSGAPGLRTCPARPSDRARAGPRARSCCTRCGRVLDEAAFSSEVTFSKGAGGESTVNGHFVSEAAASRGLGRVSGGRLFGYQARPAPRACSLPARPPAAP